MLLIITLPEAKVKSLSTISASYWKKARSWRASVVSLRYTLPGYTKR